MLDKWRHSQQTNLRARQLPAHNASRRKPCRSRDRRRAARLSWLPVAAAVAGGGVFLALSDGGQAVRDTKPLLVQLDRLAPMVGLGLSKASLTGFEMTSDNDVFDALQLDRTRSLLMFDATAARRRIEALPWVAKARIKRTFPNRIDIAIDERKPVAIWRGDDSDYLIDDDGRRLAPVGQGFRTGLPIVQGRGAAPAAKHLFKTLSHWPELRRHFAYADFVDRRRWTINLTGHRAVHLPEDFPARAIARLMAGKRGQRLIDRADAVIDLRLPATAILSQAHRPATASGFVVGQSRGRRG